MADVAVQVGDYHIALQKSDTGQYDMTADWWAILTRVRASGKCVDKIFSQSDLQDWLLRNTTKHTLVQKYKRLGFRAQFAEDADQNINLTLTRY